MRIDISNYKVIYKDEILNCVSVMPYINLTNRRDAKIDEIELIYLDDSNRMQVIIDRNENFQFVKK